MIWDLGTHLLRTFRAVFRAKLRSFEDALMLWRRRLAVAWEQAKRDVRAGRRTPNVPASETRCIPASAPPPQRSTWRAIPKAPQPEQLQLLPDASVKSPVKDAYMRSERVRSEIERLARAQYTQPSSLEDALSRVHIRSEDELREPSSGATAAAQVPGSKELDREHVAREHS